MEQSAKPISNAVRELKANLRNVARVYEWADLMGYETPKKFARAFLRHYGQRPQSVIGRMRLVRMVRHLRDAPEKSNFEIARAHGLTDEKALNKYINYHLGCPPSHIQTMRQQEFDNLLENLGSKVVE